MNRGNLSRRHPVFEVHQARDWKPTFDARGTTSGRNVCASFESPNPRVERYTDPHIEQQESELETAAERLRMVWLCAAYEFPAQPRQPDIRIRLLFMLLRQTTCFLDLSCHHCISHSSDIVRNRGRLVRAERVGSQHISGIGEGAGARTAADMAVFARAALPVELVGVMQSAEDLGVTVDVDQRIDAYIAAALRQKS